MRGDDRHQQGMFSYISPEARVPPDHPLRVIRDLVDEVLHQLSPTFARLYSRIGRPSIPPEMLLRALLLQVLYTVRSERQLIEQLDYNLLFRWFVGLNMDEPVWDPTTLPRTGSACWMAISPRRSSPACWPKRASATCCRPSTSRSTARSLKPGRASKASGPTRRTRPTSPRPMIPATRPSIFMGSGEAMPRITRRRIRRPGCIAKAPAAKRSCPTWAMW